MIEVVVTFPIGSGPHGSDFGRRLGRVSGFETSTVPPVIRKIKLPGSRPKTVQ